MSNNKLLIINGAALTACAVFDFSWRTTLLTFFMMFLPLLDNEWKKPEIYFSYKNTLSWGAILIPLTLLATIEPQLATAIIYIVIFTALPEEWFFRSYFLTRLDKVTNQPLMANIITSVLFSLLHYPVKGASALLVFFPSLLLCFIYQKRRDLILVILIHTLFNVFYITITRQITQN